MIVILPFKGERIGNVIRRLNTYTITTVMEDLENAIEQYPDATVQLYLPKFKIESDLNLNGVLDKVNRLFIY